MKDSEVRGRVLQFLYENRRENFIAFGAVQRACQIPADIELGDWLRGCKQLADYNLIEWHGVDDHTGMGQLGGVAAINAFGVEVAEGDARPPIAIQMIDQSQQINVTGSQGVQIAGANSIQQQTISDAFGKVIAAVDGANVSEAEKKEARSLLLKLLESKVAAVILGPAVHFLIDKVSRS
jgi:hypothetical protein